MTRKLTLAITREYVRRLGGKLRKDQHGDWRVTFAGCEYFSADLSDAIGVARVMAGGHPDFADAERYLAETGAQVDDSRMWRD